MKKFFVLAVIVAIFASMAVASAEDLGVQVIGGNSTESVPVSLDDLQLGQSYTIDGYAKIEPIEYLVVDWFGQFNKDADYNSVDDSREKNSHVYYQEAALKGNRAYYYKAASWQSSGNNADFAWLKFDVTNLQKTSVPFMKEITVKVVYADEYEFAGWVRQINYDHNKKCYRYNAGTTGGGTVVLNPANEEPIDMMYTGTFVIGCTLPNSVFEDEKSPLRIEIAMGENELTYHIRK